MPDSGTFTFFVIAALVLLVTPGPAVLFIVARSLEHGWRAGVVSAIGLSAGGVLHVVAAVIGLSALIANSELWFSILKYAGASYLVYLGIRALMRSGNGALPQSGNTARSSNLFFQGFMVNVLNPKSVLFILAFLPQFVDPAAGDPALQTLVLGATFIVLGVFTDLAYVTLASTMRHFFSRGAGTGGVTLKKISGLTYVGLGLYAALSGTSRQ